MRHRDIDIQVPIFLLVVAVTALGILGVAMARTEAKPPPYRIPPPPQFDLTLNPAGTAFKFTGVVDFGLTEALSQLVAAHPEVKQIVLESGGGYIAEARGAVRVLREASISTHVAGHCASACALVFAGGAQRTIDAEARLGLHGYTLRAERQFGLIDPVVEMQRDLAIYRAQGLEESFVSRLAELPQTPMWYPSHVELRAAGFVTQP